MGEHGVGEGATQADRDAGDEPDADSGVDVAFDMVMRYLNRSECCRFELHADLVGARNIALSTLLLQAYWERTGHLPDYPDASDTVVIGRIPAPKTGW